MELISLTRKSIQTSMPVGQRKTGKLFMGIKTTLRWTSSVNSLKHM